MRRHGGVTGEHFASGSIRAYRVGFIRSQTSSCVTRSPPFSKGGTRRIKRSRSTFAMKRTKSVFTKFLHRRGFNMVNHFVTGESVTPRICNACGKCFRTFLGWRRDPVGNGKRFAPSLVMITVIRPSPVYVRKPVGFRPYESLTSPFSVISLEDISFQLPTRVSFDCAIGIDWSAETIKAAVRIHFVIFAS